MDEVAAREAYLKEKWDRMTLEEREKVKARVRARGYCIQHYVCILTALETIERADRMKAPELVNE
jgi:translation initiation factor IF-3